LRNWKRRRQEREKQPLETIGGLRPVRLTGLDTVPVETLDAYRDHGEPKARLEQGVERAGWVFEQLSELGISIDKVTQQLENEGVEKFNKPFDNLMESLATTSPRQVSEVR
jgi:hypothetical protein